MNLEPRTYYRRRFPLLTRIIMAGSGGTGTDMGTGTDLATLAATLSGSESGSGLEIGSPGFMVAQSGTATEIAAFVIVAADSGTGTESCLLLVTLADLGHGFDGSGSGFDFGTGTDTAALTFSALDTGTGTESWSRVLFDINSTGTDSVSQRSFLVEETAAGEEFFGDSNRVFVETGTGVDDTGWGFTATDAASADDSQALQGRLATDQGSVTEVAREGRKSLELALATEVASVPTVSLVVVDTWTTVALATLSGQSSISSSATSTEVASATVLASLTDTATGTQSVPGLTQNQPETGTGLDTGIVAAVFLDTATGTDVGLIPGLVRDLATTTDSASSSFVQSDTGTGIDGSIVNLPLHETATGLDLGLIPGPVAEAGTGADSGLLTLALFDTGTSIELTHAGISAPETATGQDFGLIPGPVSDSGTATERASTGLMDFGLGVDLGVVGVVVVQTGSAAESGLIPGPVLETATGTDVAVYGPVVVDLAVGVEVPGSPQVSLTLTENLHGVESPSWTAVFAVTETATGLQTGLASPSFSVADTASGVAVSNSLGQHQADFGLATVESAVVGQAISDSASANEAGLIPGLVQDSALSLELVSPVLMDFGQAADSSFAGILSLDSGTGLEVGLIPGLVVETATGSEAVIYGPRVVEFGLCDLVAGPALVSTSPLESSHAADSVAMVATGSASETATGADTVTLRVLWNVTETATGVQVIPGLDFIGQELGLSLETLRGGPQVQETGTGLEVGLVPGLVVETATGTDVAVYGPLTVELALAHDVMLPAAVSLVPTETGLFHDQVVLSVAWSTTDSGTASSTQAVLPVFQSSDTASAVETVPGLKLSLGEFGAVAEGRVAGVIVQETGTGFEVGLIPGPVTETATGSETVVYGPLTVELALAHDVMLPAAVGLVGTDALVGIDHALLTLNVSGTDSAGSTVVSGVLVGFGLTESGTVLEVTVLDKKMAPSGFELALGHDVAFVLADYVLIPDVATSLEKVLGAPAGMFALGLF